MPNFTSVRLLLFLVACLVFWRAPCAFAHELEEARAELDSKTAEIAVLTASIEDTRAQVEEAHRDLENIAVEISHSQEEMAFLQQELAAVSRMLYKTDDLSMLHILTSSQSIEELIGRIVQLEAVAQQAAQLIAQEEKLGEELRFQYGEIGRRKDESLHAEQQLSRTKEALESSVASLEEHIAQLEEEAARTAAEAAARAALEAAQQAAAEAAAVQGLAVVNGQVDVEKASEVPVRQEAPVEEGQAVDRAQDAEGNAEGDADGDAVPVQEQVQAQGSQLATGWSTGIASAYGGSSDPYTPNPGTTATGAVCDDYSMGVAVPIAWGPSAYYGRMVEISYGGTTVVATVNDCGGMGGGSRSLDLQPGVVKAFGFSTCQEWGLREVSYRFL